MAKSSDPAVRAGALLRLARNLCAAGRSQEALSAYAQLSGTDGVSAGGVPAGLVARYARCELLEEEKRLTDLRVEARRLGDELGSGRWALTGSVYWLYAGDAAQWSGAASPRAREEEVFAEAADALWQKWNSMASSGQASLSIGGQTLAVLWQTSGGSFRALIAASRFVESQWLAAIAPVIEEQRITFALRDPAGKVAFGTLGTGDGPQATRRSGDTGLPWHVEVASAGTADSSVRVLRTITADYALMTMAKLSPDGRFVAFTGQPSFCVQRRAKRQGRDVGDGELPARSQIGRQAVMSDE